MDLQPTNTTRYPPRFRKGDILRLSSGYYRPPTNDYSPFSVTSQVSHLDAAHLNLIIELVTSVTHQGEIKEKK